MRTESKPNSILRTLKNIGDSVIIEVTEDDITFTRAGLFQYDRRPDDLKDVKVTVTKILGVIVSHKNVGDTMHLLKITRVA